MIISMQFKQRLLFGTFFFIIALCSIYYSAHPFFKPFFLFFNAGLICTALFEYYHLAKLKGNQPLITAGITCAAIYIFAIGFSNQSSFFAVLPEFILLGSLLYFFLKLFNHRFHALGSLAFTIFGYIYLVIPLSCAIQINYFFQPEALQDGRLWLAYVLFISKMNDIGAYFIGKSLGKTKLAPTISPKKTIEGSIGGLVTALLASVAFAFFSNEAFQLTIWQSLWIGLLISILAQIGDLAESLLKRDAQVKDSSHLPGFGGILDVVDSLVFTLPLMYLLLKANII